MHWKSSQRQGLLFKQRGQQADNVNVGVGRRENWRVEILVCLLMGGTKGTWLEFPQLATSHISLASSRILYPVSLLLKTSPHPTYI